MTPNSVFFLPYHVPIRCSETHLKKETEKKQSWISEDFEVWYFVLLCVYEHI